MKYEILDPNEEHRILIPDDGTEDDLVYIMRVVRMRDPRFWRHWIIWAYDANGEPHPVDPTSV
jgi:hypothetical protein